MSQFVVDSESLEAVAGSLGELTADLDGIAASAGLYDASVLGGLALAQALEVFDHRWSYGVAEVSGEITDMMGALRTAAEAYERIDRRIEHGARHHPATGTGITTIGGPAGHHHHRATGTGTTVIDGRNPPRGTGVLGGGAASTNGGGAIPGHPVAGASQGAGAPPPIVVSSPSLSEGQETFVAHLSTLTGLDPRVLAAWTLAEKHGHARVHHVASIYHDWLHVGHRHRGHHADWRDPERAAQRTAQFLEGRWGGASDRVRLILSTAGASPEHQLQAIADAHADASRGALLRESYAQLSGMTVRPG